MSERLELAGVVEERVADELYRVLLDNDARVLARPSTAFAVMLRARVSPDPDASAGLDAGRRVRVALAPQETEGTILGFERPGGA